MESKRTGRSGWHPGVRALLVLVVLLPLCSTAVVTGASAVSSWKFRQGAERAAEDAANLETIANARAELSVAQAPVAAVSFAAQMGLGEQTLEGLLDENFPSELARSIDIVSSTPTFSATPVLRAERAKFLADISGVEAGTTTYDSLSPVLTDFNNDVDAFWFSNYHRLQQDIGSWTPPASFDTQVAGLRLTYEAFLGANGEIEYASYVLAGQGGDPAKQDLISFKAQYDAATSEFAGDLGPLASKAWTHLETSQADQNYATTIQDGIDLSFSSATPPWLTDPSSAGPQSQDGLNYLGDVAALVRNGSLDLRGEALAQESSAKHRFIVDLALLLVLVLLSFGGVFTLGNTMIRPLKKLALFARKVHDGDFDLEKLSQSGPKEVTIATSAFNDMASTLKGLEGKVVALSAEDLTSPELSVPLPGRTGQALQGVVERLVERIRERELQREQLYDEATHDRLTGLLNRGAVLEYLEKDVRGRRDLGETVAVIFIDIDGLKVLNDTHGHEAGDAAIVATAEAIVAAMGDRGVAGRLGGDEFLAVLSSDEQRAERSIAERIRQNLAGRTIQVKNATVPFQASIGVALTECDSDTDPADLVRRADEAMYEAKVAARAARGRSEVASQV